MRSKVYNHTDSHMHAEVLQFLHSHIAECRFIALRAKVQNSVLKFPHRY